ncbi:DUF4105 domain-containing protein [Novilysobacter defluvii]|uniref:Membrane protein n=1 Tax=Lysobacter defluvii IMMIB APB-9 = DSM 18482 TaxID=1385515 RepID=A0A0A0M912_9GAMM|nr:DUF4105 domain-containing protein [Lysobacter defluvii]KGO99508.1 membrane protein [Lysobacter defluvii IMMIB APB-9 = DSM 18482]
MPDPGRARQARRARTRRLLLSALALLSLLLATAAGAAPRIAVLTMQPGEVFFERFGHNALVVADPATGAATSYNFGYFDPTEPGFITGFIRGEMQYQLVALPLEQDLAYYRDVGRGVDIQWLDLEPDVATELAAQLEWNARPENARYGYDYFLDNCSTRVRDALDEALGGSLRSQMAGSRGSSYRSEATRLARPEPMMWLGFDLGLGPASDRPLSLWEEAFVPMRLQAQLRRARNAEGRPLVSHEERILPHRLPPEPAELPRRWWPWLLGGVLVAAGAGWLAVRRPRLGGAFALVFWSLCSVLAALMLFIWLGTEHRFGWANRNLLVFSPVCVLLLPGAIAWIRGRVSGRWFRALLWVPVCTTIAAGFVYGLSRFPQQDLHWILAVLPVHVALAWAWGRRR